MQPAELTLDRIVLLLFLASMVAAWIGHLRIPYTVGLVLAGVALDALGFLPATTLSPQIFLWVLLPPLLFEAAFLIRWDQLAKVALPVLVLATLGVVVSALVTAGLMIVGVHLDWHVALLFGVLVAATDPVAVVAFFRRVEVTPELRVLVEGESLLNDGTVVVLVGVLAAYLTVGQVGPTFVAEEFLRVALGGLFVGVLAGFLGSVLARNTNDYLVEATVSVATAFGSFLVAQNAGVSGVLAVAAAGSVLGNFGRRFGLAPLTQDEVDKLWAFLAFVANSMVFLLLGIAVVPSVLRTMLPEIAFGVVATLAGRAIVAYGLGAVMARLNGIPRLSWRHVLFWGGLRGALPVVVSLVIADELGLPPLLQNLVLGVVVVTLLLQGLTLEPVLARALDGDMREEK